MCSTLEWAQGLVNKHKTLLKKLAGTNTLAYFGNISDALFRVGCLSYLQTWLKKLAGTNTLAYYGNS